MMPSLFGCPASKPELPPLRRWQVKAVPAAVKAAKEGRDGVVAAVMGAGKSRVILELALELTRGLPKDWKIVITTSKQKLVRQLAASLGRVMPVGQFYADQKDLHQQVIVSCVPSTATLAQAFQERGEKCALWIADEAHRSNGPVILEAHQLLQPYVSIGFTATPFLSSEREKLHLFEDLIYEYSAQDAMQDGVVVTPVLRHYDGQATDVDDAIIEMIGDVEGPGLVNARSIADAKSYACKLSDCNIPAAAIHSKLHQDDQDRLIRELEAGRLKCLVHVQLLTEGVDLPWLRWLGMRTPVGSRVRFCQEVGRVLRSYPGKDHAFLLDPLDLFNDFNLTYEVALGGGAEEEKDELKELAEGVLDVEAPMEEAERLVLIDPVASYLRRLCLALYSAGLAKREIKSRAWRTDWPSDAQLRTVRGVSCYAVMAPEPHRLALETAIEIAPDLSKGDVSDLLETLFTLKRHKRWPDLKAMEAI